MIAHDATPAAQYGVMCECGVSGPTCMSEAGAMAQWNMLAGQAGRITELEKEMKAVYAKLEQEGIELH